jgi:signal transduction histidine kinase
MRYIPKSLSLRLFIILAIVLFLAQLLSAYLHFQDRGQVLYHTAELNSAERIAGIVRLLNAMPPEARQRAVAELNVPPLQISLDRPGWPQISTSEPALAARLKRRLATLLGEHWSVRVRIRDASAGEGALANLSHSHTPPTAPYRMPDDMHENRLDSGLSAFSRMSFLIQIKLHDGTWVTFDHAVPAEVFVWPQKLLWSLIVLLVSVVIVTLIAVRWLTRPLANLSNAADALGRDINRPPLEEKGSIEVRNAARAFNNMQARLKRLMRDRSRMMAAVSHDLKTPITRLRLRTEMLEDEQVKDKFCLDLDEMESMVQSALDFMRDLENDEPAQAMDINALLEVLQADAEEGGQRLDITGGIHSPYRGKPLALKRCLSNLVGNAIKYGKKAKILVEDNQYNLRLRIADEGPGLPESELERVFEPFYRLENSRSRQTGGTGLGLSIAHNIARAHGGKLILRNRPEGGLEAELTLPRHHPNIHRNRDFFFSV